jgi:hypothetical protein
MGNTSRGGSPSAPSQSSFVHVRRIANGESVHFRCLSEFYGGLLTHWEKTRSRVCLGEDCKSPQHKIETIWKGYIAAEELDRRHGAWHPVVLEISEHAELDLRGRYKRGQVWKFSRFLKDGKKQSSVTAELLGEYDMNAVPAAFDVNRVLLHMYHVQAIDLGAKNPLPDRVVAVSSKYVEPGSEFTKISDTPRGM